MVIASETGRLPRQVEAGAGHADARRGGLPYRTEILQLVRDTFKVRVHNPGQPVEITFVPAEGRAP